MQNKRDVAASLFLILVGIAVITWSVRLGVGTLLSPLAGFFPFLVGCGIIGLSLILLFQGWMGRGDAPRKYGNWRRPLLMVAALAVYAVILDPLGYIPSTFFIGAVTLRVLGVPSWRVIILSSLVLSASVYFLFTRLLGVELPAGVLPFLG